jgi:hypothetical protein
MLRNGPDHNVIHGVHAKGIYMNGGGVVFQTPVENCCCIYVIAGKMCKIPCHDMTEILAKLKLNNTIIIILESGQHDTICTIIQRIRLRSKNMSD